MPEERGSATIGNVESVAYYERERDEAPERLSVEAGAPVSVGGLTASELDLQRRLVRDSLLLRPACPSAQPREPDERALICGAYAGQGR